MLKFIRNTALWILLSPLAISLVGAGSNQLVLYVNHDTFPVSINPVKLQKFTGGEVRKTSVGPYAADGGVTITLADGTELMDETHCVMTKRTHLNWLADVFDFHDSIESIGDLLLGLGAWLWTFAPFVWAYAVINALMKREQ